MFKATLAILFKSICNTASFELLSYRRLFYLVKRSEFDHITDSLHDTHAPFHTILSLLDGSFIVFLINWIISIEFDWYL